MFLRMCLYKWTSINLQWNEYRYLSVQHFYRIICHRRSKGHPDLRVTPLHTQTHTSSFLNSMHESEQMSSCLMITVQNMVLISILSPSFLQGVHGDLCRGDALQAGGHGSILLLPGGLELFRRFHCDAEFSGVGFG